MDGGALFCVRTEARIRVLTEISEIHLHKKKVGSYTYNDANTSLTQIKRVLELQLFKDSSDVMKRLVSGISNTLNKYISTIDIKKRDVLVASRAAANLVRTDDSTVEPEISNNSDT